MAKAKSTQTVEETIVQMRNDGANWVEISTATGVRQGKAMLIYMQETTPANQRIKAKDDEELAAKIVKARDEELSSWGLLSARTGLPESKVRRLYESVAGSTKGNRIGKGGRYPANGEAPAPKAKAPATKAAKATKDAKQSGNGTTAAKQSKLASMDFDQIKNRLEGKTIRVLRSNGKEERIAVKGVSALKGGTLSFSDADGKSRTVKVEAIAGASK